ncbi:MipA/OmpV family protein [Thalassotalea litorea]|uniref:MipA/OmpV family protein n=1 Tax=Thalassotalea litorea TaxID=2020715 RepID=A0A5R9IF74_9GAMM|nr:MipA/OmpV family protein [Thalassotalea litorea]TLU62013.1 MipA/OmpV family protein [Thalassotalea litorea]
MINKIIIFTLFFWLSANAIAFQEEVNQEANRGRGENRSKVEPYGFIYGLGLSLNNEIYKGYDRRFIPLPVIGYRGETFTIYGPFASYDVYETDSIEISLKLAPRFAGFDEDDSFIFAGMAERKFSMDAGLGFRWQKDDWRFDTQAVFDVLGRYNGYELTASFGKVFSYGPFFFEPNIGLSYVDDKMADYYYGVRANEVSAQRSFYQAGSALNPTLGVSFFTPVLLGGITRMGIKKTWFADSIVDSPLTDESSRIDIFFAYSRRF